jgi:hypothetical protein
LVIVGIRPGVIAVVVVVIIVIVVRVIHGPNRLRRHEQRLVVGPLRALLGRGLEHQPGLGLIHLSFGSRSLYLDFGRHSRRTGNGVSPIGLLSRRRRDVQRLRLSVLRRLCLF